MGSLKERAPLDDFNLQEETQEGFDNQSKFPSKLEKYGNAKSNALINLAQLEETLKNIPPDSLRYRFLNRTKISLAKCCSYMVFKDYYTVGKIRLSVADFCKKHLLCQLCAIRWGAKALQAYVAKYNVLKAEHPALKLTMITITIKNGDDLKERFEHMKKSIAIMLERRRNTIKGVKYYHSHEFAKMFAGVGKYEVTKDNGVGEIKETGWHVHLHLMVLAYVTFDWAKFKAEWHEITGDSCVINFAEARHPNDPAQDMMEVFKYVVKPSDLTPEEILQVYEILSNEKLLISFGGFRGVVVPDDLTDADLSALPYIERFYLYLDKIGYSLTKTRDIDPKKDDASQEDWQAVKNASTLPKLSPIEAINPIVWQDSDFL